MQAIHRYSCVLATILCVFFVHLIVSRLFQTRKPQETIEHGVKLSLKLNASLSDRWQTVDRELALDELTNFENENNGGDGAVRSKSVSRNVGNECKMKTCFDLNRCVGFPFKVHIYPKPNSTSAADAPRLSETYSKILSAIHASPFHTNDPGKACVFVLSYDTLDRDRLSQTYDRQLETRLIELSPDLWQNGQNHIIFNMYYGSFPNYLLDDVGFDRGSAIMARASTSITRYRAEFDIAFPLFHKELPLFSDQPETTTPMQFDNRFERFLLVFKGKRYVYGIGSETRNSLYHLHNGRDVIMLTTCKHGKDWEKMQDERCVHDNEMYDRPVSPFRWQYDWLMSNSTFCLVPRGRRLGSFRFLESLRAGCIPVILSDDWHLPFTDLIDWSQAAFRVDERMLFQVPDMLRDVPRSVIVRMKQKARGLFLEYFSSVDKIVRTTLTIIQTRIQHASAAPPLNRASKQLLFTSVLADRPYYETLTHDRSFTLVLYVTRNDSNTLKNNLRNVLDSGSCRQIVVIQSFTLSMQSELRIKSWSRDVPIKWLNLTSLTVCLSKPLLQPNKNRLSDSVVSYDAAAVLSITDRQTLTAEMINAALLLWRWFPSRIVGRYARSYQVRQRGDATDKAPIFSTLALDLTVFHRLHVEAFNRWSTCHACRRAVSHNPDCIELLFPLYISHITGQSPVQFGHEQSDVADVDVGPNCLTAFLWQFSDAHHQNITELPYALSLAQPQMYTDTIELLRKQQPAFTT